MNNFTDYSSSWVDSNNSIDCNDLTNNGLYLIFVGYVLPLLSPKVRSYGREILSTIKNLGNVAGSIVSLTEFGFEKVQELSNNGEMINFIQRVCMVNDLNVLPNEIIELSWKFSGDTNNGKKENIQQTWKKLLSELNHLSTLNTMDRTTKP
ncbi:MAG: hypothetical protein CL470_05965 [Acidimicrobiaceae bacterium]|nr:hypothetical protein [Acidimicrobiaceae bacterium]|tara:strand:- start:611 stop:1063 length:453 start_codon:yes stop_codon:yes gene_type:complete